MNRKALQLALRRLQSVAASRTARIGMILAIVLLAVSGPFGTFQSFNLGQRLVYWSVMVVVSYFVGQAGATFFLELLARQIRQKWPRVIVAALLTSLPVTIAVLLVNGVAYQYVPADESLMIWFYVVVVSLVVVVTLVTIDEMMTGRMAGAAAPAPADTPRAASAAILERVPLPQRGRLLALVVEDHYVDIVTDRGKTLVLMRLADAIRETAPVEGLQIHRSHWVALGAVTRAIRADGRLTLELSNGMKLPVSRGYLAEVKAAGLG